VSGELRVPAILYLVPIGKTARLVLALFWKLALALGVESRSRSCTDCTGPAPLLHQVG
jgi:hypothetical protein